VASRGAKRILKGIIRRARTELRKLLDYPAPYAFLAAPSVERQTIRFRFLGRTLTVEADYDTPLYETVAEVVDYDCYQLRRVADALRNTAVLDVGANIGVTR
jgi:hypothetical protein